MRAFVGDTRCVFLGICGSDVTQHWEELDMILEAQGAEEVTRSTA